MGVGGVGAAVCGEGQGQEGQGYVQTDLGSWYVKGWGAECLLSGVGHLAAPGADSVPTLGAQPWKSIPVDLLPMSLSPSRLGC